MGLKKWNDIPSDSTLLKSANWLDLKALMTDNYEFVTENPLAGLHDFFSKFNWIEAAGGLVRCQETFLFIERLGKWDLPKGKLEEGETPLEGAAREIIEECGIENKLQNGEWLENTYHTYWMKGKSVVKKTYWFTFDYDGNRNLVPQTEEGITAVSWLQREEFNKVKENTYPSILEVINKSGLS